MHSNLMADPDPPPPEPPIKEFSFAYDDPEALGDGPTVPWYGVRAWPLYDPRDTIIPEPGLEPCYDGTDHTCGTFILVALETRTP